jgi:[ribosomal protein S5]-alanine N-acetyltransferase
MALEHCWFCHRSVAWVDAAPASTRPLARCQCGAVGVRGTAGAAEAEGAAAALLSALELDARLALASDAGRRDLLHQLESHLRALGYRFALVRGGGGGESWACWAQAGGGAHIETPRLLLRELEESDAAAANVWESDPEVVRYQSTDVIGVDESLSYIRHVRLESARRPRLLYDLAAARREDGLLIGRVGLRVSRPEHREGELWFVFRRDVWGQGYAGEAAGAMLELGFGRLGLHRIWGDCDPRNARSARLMEKLGMRREAHLRENWWLKGEWCDSWIYAMLESEWAARS